MMAPFIRHSGHQCGESNGKEDHDEMALKPIFTLAFIENNLQRAETKSDERDADVVDLQFAANPGRLSFFNELWRIRNKPMSENKADQPDGHVDEKHPEPGE